MSAPNTAVHKTVSSWSTRLCPLGSQDCVLLVHKTVSSWSTRLCPLGPQDCVVLVHKTKWLWIRASDKLRNVNVDKKSLRDCICIHFHLAGQKTHNTHCRHVSPNTLSNLGSSNVEISTMRTCQCVHVCVHVCACVCVCVSACGCACVCACGCACVCVCLCVCVCVCVCVRQKALQTRM